MGFDSAGYYFFLYGVICLLWLWRPSAHLLLAASLLFYGLFDWRLLPLLVAMSALSWAGALWLEKGKSKGKLAALLALAFLPLLAWKLLDAAQGSIAFPLGLSFFTFHCASYLIDCYRGAWKAEGSFSRVLLYVAFFPQLVAGPITRAKEIFPQLAALARPSKEETKRALWRIYLGLFKKLAIANVVGIFAIEVFREPAIYHGWVVLFAVVFARYYIYADFSGYTDIAIGSARLLGITLPENFRRPFAAPSIGEYWQRWHITLSAWIRDYVLYPLVASPLSRGGLYPLLLITFLLLGLWHGFTVNFVLYGLWHGLMLVLYEATRAKRQTIWRALGLEKGIAASWIFPWLTFFLLVCPPTVLFLTRTPQAALGVVEALANGQGRTYVKGVQWYHLATAELSIIALELYQWLQARFDCFRKFEALPAPLRWAGVVAAAAWLLLAGEFAVEKGFLYFQF